MNGFSNREDILTGISNIPETIDRLEPPEVHMPGVVNYTIIADIVNRPNEGRRIQLQFNAKACVISNLTGQWLFAPFINMYVPPFVIGMIHNIIGGAQTVDFVPETPNGQASAPVSGQLLNVTFWNINLNPNPGTLPVNIANVVAANQGAPNAGGALAWPVTIVGAIAATFTAPVTTSFNLIPAVNGLNVLKNAPGALWDYTCNNPNAVAIFLQLYDNAAANFGTGVGLIRSIPIPPNGMKDLAPFTGITFANRIVAAFSTTTGAGTNPGVQPTFSGGYV